MNETEWRAARFKYHRSQRTRLPRSCLFKFRLSERIRMNYSATLNKEHIQKQLKDVNPRSILSQTIW